MKGRSEMKRIILFLPLFLLICCINKNQELSTGNDKKNKKSTAERKNICLMMNLIKSIFIGMVVIHF